MSKIRLSPVLGSALLFITACSADDASNSTTSVLDERAVTSQTEPGPRSGITVIVDADVYTLDQAQPWVESFAYDHEGVIIAVGTEAKVFAAAGDNPTIIDGGGNMVVPGFQDAHVHVPEAGINLEVCFMPDGLQLDDYEALAADCALEQPESEWVRGAGASLFDLRDTEESPLDVLDRAVPDRPAVILDNLGHAVWTNSLGLEAAGIGEDDPDPQGGVFHRDHNGDLTGLLLEDAQQLVRNAAAPDGETNYRGLLTALRELAREGVTSVSDAGGYWLQSHPEAWERAAAEGTLTVRASNSLYVYPDLPLEEQLAEFDRRFSDADESLRFDTAKIYIDGILDLGTAWLLEPYDIAVDDNYPSGFRYFELDQLQTYVAELHQLGYRISFHAIGDGAVRAGLDAIEAIPDDPEAVADRRHRITHTYLVDETDLPRFSQLGVVADFQQSPDAVAADYHDALFEIIGDRAFGLLPTTRLLEAGASVSLSSDWDAGPLSPLGTIERSLTRSTNAVPDLETALSLATIDAAYALGHDHITGSIEIGKQADYVVLDQNLFEIDFSDIDDTRVLMTVVGGRVVHRSTAITNTVATPSTVAAATTTVDDRTGSPGPDWLGTRLLPLRPGDDNGVAQPTPPELVDRQLWTTDVLPPPIDGVFVATVASPPPSDVLARSTFRDECPVAADDISYATVSFFGFDGLFHTGEFIASVNHVDALVDVFAALHEMRFPIEQMHVTTQAAVDAHPTGDSNNTSSFVCRPAVNSSSWSRHALGGALDINPFHNPYVKGDLVIPELATAYLDRDMERVGMVTPAVVALFAEIGWGWGGSWSSASDWMHFSDTGG